MLFQRLKLSLEKRERPANPSTWAGDRWDTILNELGVPIKNIGKELTESMLKFKRPRKENSRSVHSRSSSRRKTTAGFEELQEEVPTLNA